MDRKKEYRKLKNEFEINTYFREYNERVSAGELRAGLDEDNAAILVGIEKKLSLLEFEPILGKCYWTIFKRINKLQELGYLKNGRLLIYEQEYNRLKEESKKEQVRRRTEEMNGYHGPKNSKRSLGFVLPSDKESALVNARGRRRKYKSVEE